MPIQHTSTYTASIKVIIRLSTGYRIPGAYGRAVTIFLPNFHENMHDSPGDRAFRYNHAWISGDTSVQYEDSRNFTG